VARSKKVRRAVSCDINDRYSRETAVAARAGDTDAAREILSDFAAEIDRWSENTWRGPLPWHHVRYLADSLYKIAEEKNAKPDHASKALGLIAKKSGRRRGAKRTHNTEALAAAYWFLIRRGYRPERAIAQLAKRTGADRTTIQRARVADGNGAYGDPTLVSDEELKAILKPYAAAIAAILTAYTYPNARA